MANVKSGTIISHISMVSQEADSTWITNHYNGLLKTVTEPDTLLAETGLVLETELAVDIQLQVGNAFDIEITHIPFTGDEAAEPNKTAGQYSS